MSVGLSTAERRTGWLEPPVTDATVDRELSRLSRGLLHAGRSVSRWRSGYVRVIVWEVGR